MKGIIDNMKSITKLNLIVSITFILIGVIALVVIPNISRIYYEKPNVTVHLKNCHSQCEIVGTLRKNPFMKKFYIDNSEGRTYFGYDGFTKMVIPVSQDNTFSILDFNISDLIDKTSKSYSEYKSQRNDS